MRNLTKITCGLCFLVGAVLTTVGFAKVNFNFKELIGYSDFTWHDKSIAIENISDIDIDMELGTYELLSSSETDQVLVSYYSNQEKSVNIKTEQAELSISDDYDFSKTWYDMFQTLQNRHKVKITIPEKQYHSLEFSFTTGIVDIKNITAETLSIKQTSGSVKATNINGTSLSIRQTSGTINIDGCKFTSLNTNTTSGSTTIKNAFINSTTFSITSGTLRINYLQAKADFNIHVSITSGNCNAKNQSSTGPYRINGNITSGNAVLNFLN